MFTPAVRQALYALGVAVGAVLVTLGVMKQELLESILGALNALLGVLAVLNVKRNPGPNDPTPPTEQPYRPVSAA